MNRYQAQLADVAAPIYQTIAPLDLIDPAKVLHRKSTHGNIHGCRHYTTIVPMWRFLQGRRRTWFCGAYTLFNIHEMAIVSGLAVAHKLGAPYPFSTDPKARKIFESYLRIVHQ